MSTLRTVYENELLPIGELFTKYFSWRASMMTALLVSALWAWDRSGPQLSVAYTGSEVLTTTDGNYLHLDYWVNKIRYCPSTSTRQAWRWIQPDGRTPINDINLKDAESPPVPKAIMNVERMSSGPIPITKLGWHHLTSDEPLDERFVPGTWWYQSNSIDFCLFTVPRHSKPMYFIVPDIKPRKSPYDR